MSNEVHRVISSADVHRSHYESKDKDPSKKLDDDDPLELEKFIVKLRFDQGSGELNGTGFYINIPDTKNDVILTAGHNLISNNGQRSKILEVSGAEDATREDIGFEINATYEKNPGEQNAAEDYGVILLPRGSKAGVGFGFCIKLGFNTPGRDIHVTGYGPKGNLVSNTGSLANSGDQLQYSASTAQGMSGSPVWVAYNGYKTAVGIHNYGPERSGQGSRGTHLTEKVFRDVFRWVGAGHLKKKLRVFHRDAPTEGLYLHFYHSKKGARMQIGADEVHTDFDILPAYSWPTQDRTVLYVFAIHRPQNCGKEETQWVKWRAEQDIVELTDKLQDSCLVVVAQKGRTSQFYIVQDLGVYREDKVEFRVKPPSKEDIQLKMSLPLSSGKHLGRPEKFNVFCFE